MPVFDSPITTDDHSVERVIGQKLPVMIYLFDAPNKPVEDALNAAARENAGDLLITRINARENPATYARFGQPALPALVTLDEGIVESKAVLIRPDDVDAHVDFLLGQGPKPLETAAEAESKSQRGAAPQPTSDARFAQDVLQSSLPVLVDFWAPWCGPCRTIAPSLDRLAERYAGRVRIAKLNVDENPRMAREYQANSIPLLVLFKNGKAIGRLLGAHPEPNIERFLQQGL